MVTLKYCCLCLLPCETSQQVLSNFCHVSKLHVTSKVSAIAAKLWTEQLLSACVETPCHPHLYELLLLKLSNCSNNEEGKMCRVK